MGKVQTFLTFKGGAEEAVNLYTSLIPNSQITSLQKADGAYTLISFELDGVAYQAMDVSEGPFAFAEGFSLYVNCDSQEEVNQLWDALTADGGEESMCGWLKDRWGVSWQIVPTRLVELMSDPDPEKAGRVTEAMLKMRKIIISDLEAAYAS